MKTIHHDPVGLTGVGACWGTWLRRFRVVWGMGLAVGVTAGVQAVPTITSFAPNLGGPGYQVTLNGADLATASVVTFGDVVADFTAVSATRIIAVVPPDALTGRIRVTGPGGTGTSSQDFLVAPRVTGLSPERGASNSTVMIEGYNFVGVTNVVFGTNRAVFSVTAATMIQATVPAVPTNALVSPVIVRSPAGEGAAPLPFTVTGPAPIIDDFTPAVGPPGSTTDVVLRGANFVGVNSVKFGTAAATFTVVAANQINTRVPANAATNAVKITVTSPAGSTVSTADFLVTRLPVITTFDPAYGKTNYTDVTIDGVNLDNATGVGFNGVPVSAISKPSPNRLVVRVPPTATTGPISVTNVYGRGLSSSNFVVTQRPIIEYFDPLSGNPGTPVTISGANLSNGPTVLRFNTTVTPFNVTGAGGTQIRAIVPNGATTGPISLSNSFGVATTVLDFTVLGSPPFVFGADPPSGPRGTAVKIRGRNFTAPVVVRFAGVVDATAVAVSDSQINATVPASATSGLLTVTSGTKASTNTVWFYLPPRLTSFTPTNGPVGTDVVLSGTNFPGTTRVTFNGASAEFEVTASNRITARVPEPASSGAIEITTLGGVIRSTNSFLVPPHITGFSPALGPVGTVVTVDGTSFLGATQVTFGGAPATFTVLSNTVLTAAVPPNAATGPIRVSTPGGTGVSSNAFVVTGPSDLALTKSASAALVSPGTDVVFVVELRNAGSATVTGAKIVDTLPAGWVVGSAESTEGTCGVTNQVVTCNIGTFTNGASVTLTIVAQTAVQGVYTNTATATATEGDTAPANNTAQAGVTVASEAGRTLSIELTAGGDAAALSWPASAIPYELVQKAALGGTNFWAGVTNTPVLSGGRYVVTVPITSDQRYYKLQLD